MKFKDFANEHKNVLYNGESGSGVIIPYNVGPISSGKITVLATGSNPKEVSNIFDKLQKN